MTTGYDVIVIGGRSGRLSRRDPRRAARAEDRLHRQIARRGRQAGARRYVPQLGCIPSKALLDASHKYVEAQRRLLPAIGIKAGEGRSGRRRQMMARKKPTS